MKRLLSSFLAVSLCLSPVLTKNTEAIDIGQIWNGAKDFIKQYIGAIKFINNMSKEEKEKVANIYKCCSDYLLSSPSPNLADSDCCQAYIGFFGYVEMKVRESEKTKNFATPTPQPQVEL